VFDHEQAKDIRLHLGILILFLIVIISVLTYQIVAGKVINVNGVTIAIGVMLTIEILIIRRFLKIHEENKKRCATNALSHLPLFVYFDMANAL
jgi:hypothetical protein